MEKLSGFPLGLLPIKDFRKINDLLEYDGPILSHFVDAFNNNYLFYWVDNDERNNRWLIWQVSIEDIFYYTNGEYSLSHLLTSEQIENIYSVDINEDLEFVNILLMKFQEIPRVYIPGQNSYLFSDIEEEHYEYIFDKLPDSLKIEFEALKHNAVLKRDAIYIKLEQRFGISQPFSETPVNSFDAGTFLEAFSNSFKEYFGFFSLKILTQKLTDLKIIKNHIDQIKKSIELKVVDMHFASFGVALSADFLMFQNPYLSQDFAKETFENYKKHVIEIDYSSDKQITLLANLFDDNSRRLIYGPIIKVFEVERNVISVTNRKFEKTKTLKPISQSNKLLLIPEKLAVVKEQEEFEIRIAQVEVGKTSQKVKGAPNLFDNTTQPSIVLNEIANFDNSINYKLKIGVIFLLLESDKMFYLENNMLGLYVSGDSLTSCKYALAEEFDYLYTRYNSLPDDQLTRDVLLIKLNINNLVIS
jgi:hypothetical protein